MPNLFYNLFIGGEKKGVEAISLLLNLDRNAKFKLIDILCTMRYTICYEITKAKCRKNDPKPSG